MFLLIIFNFTHLRGYAFHNKGFLGGTSGQEPACYAGDMRDTNSIPGQGRSPGGGHGNSLQNFSPENPMDREARQTTVHRDAEPDMAEATQHACMPFNKAKNEVLFVP